MLLFSCGITSAQQPATDSVKISLDEVYVINGVFTELRDTQSLLDLYQQITADQDSLYNACLGKIDSLKSREAFLTIRIDDLVHRCGGLVSDLEKEKKRSVRLGTLNKYLIGSTLILSIIAVLK